MNCYTFLMGVVLIALFLAVGWYIFICKYDDVSLLKIFSTSTIKEYTKDYIFEDKKFAIITVSLIIITSIIIMLIINYTFSQVLKENLCVMESVIDFL